MPPTVPPFPNGQALSSNTFKPPLALLRQENATVPDLFDWNATHSPDHPLFLYDDNGTRKTISWKTSTQGVHRAAYYFTRLLPADFLNQAVQPVIAILATLDTITFVCSIIGSLRAGFTVLLISPRNAPDAIVHLLKKTGAKHLFVSSDPATQDLAEAAIKQSEADLQESPFRLYATPQFEDLFLPDGNGFFEPFPPRTYDVNSSGLILHSSGSTAFPKPILCSHRSLMNWSRVPWYGALDLTGVVIGYHSLPVYHAFGITQLSMTAAHGGTLATFRPQFPPIVPSPDKVFEDMVATNTELSLSVPTFLEQWSVDPKKVAYMSRMKGVVFGGGPLSKDIGDFLVSKGVCLYALYGSTEGGSNRLFPEDPKQDWEYFQVSENIPHEFVPREDGTYELILLASEHWAPGVLNTKLEGHDGYATNDLFLPHASKPGFWKIFGRGDDQLMLSTGEKTNPGPLEKILIQDPHIRGAVMFGRGRFQNGVLVDPKPQYAFDPRDQVKLEKFRNIIWPTVERMNDAAPQHSRIFKEMILLASPDKPVEYNLKAFPRRQAVIKQYEKEITAIYNQVENPPIDTVHDTRDWTPESTLEFVRDTVHGVMKYKVSDEDDLFQFGCDSLQATWIRIGILRALKGLDPKVARSLDLNFVFQAPTVFRLAKLVYNAIQPSQSNGTAGASKEQELLSLVTKYTSSFPSRPQGLRSRDATGDVVLLTGTTGGFGCNVLAHLSLDPSVKKVYAFNRRSGDPLLRQFQTMERQGLLEECLRNPKFHLVEGDLSQPALGLKADLFKEIRDSITHIIHNAWPVDFNRTLSSFESNIQGIRGLVDLALASPYQIPPSILFISSIGIFKTSTGGPAREEHISDPANISPAGYGSAKWVGERILHEASVQAGLRTTVVRAGQLCGDRNGHWNEKEWFPSIVKSALSVHCLPDVEGEGLVSWIPSYDAAAALVQMRHSDEQVLHLVSPNPVPWRSFLVPFSEVLGVPLVPLATWIEAMEKDLQSSDHSEVELMKRNPGLRLLSTFRSADPTGDEEPLNVVRLDTTRAKKAAPSLNAVRVGPEWVDKWAKFWGSSGFLPSAEESAKHQTSKL